ncbi:MAG TPA: hypothetical protein VGA40_03000 [Candidatus Acidoferrales bacterium]
MNRQPRTPKKPYSSPRLETYGDIRTTTLATGSMTIADGALHGNTKTQ